MNCKSTLFVFVCFLLLSQAFGDDWFGALISDQIITRISINASTLEKQFSEWLGSPKRVQLLYSVRGDGGISTVFHEKCDNKGPTITVIENAHGSVYGGYTSMSWQSPSTGTYYKDTSSFLFSLKFNATWNPNMYPVSKASYAIYMEQDAGPVFGGGASYYEQYRDYYHHRQRKVIVPQDLFTFSGEMLQSGTLYNLHLVNFGSAYAMKGHSDIHNGVLTVQNIEVYRVFDRVEKAESWRRDVAWSDEVLEQLKSDVRQYQPPSLLRVPEANLLLIGPVGSGKSSFFNTLNSIFRGYVSSQAQTGTADHSVTTKFRKYGIRTEDFSRQFNIKLHDTAGMDERRYIDEDEIKFFLNGNIPDGYEFDSTYSINKTDSFASGKSRGRGVHCVALVLDGNSFGDLSPNLMKRMKKLREKMNAAGLPQVVLLTKIDRTCPHVAQNVTNVFHSEVIAKLVDKVANVVGLPRSHILPIKNYEKELELRRDINILALLALKQMLRFSDDYLYNFLPN